MGYRHEQKQTTYTIAVPTCDDCGQELPDRYWEAGWGLSKLNLTFGERDDEKRYHREEDLRGLRVIYRNPEVESKDDPEWFLCPDCAEKIIGRLETLREERRAREKLRKAEAEVAARGKSREETR